MGYECVLLSLSKDELWMRPPELVEGWVTNASSLACQRMS